MKTPTLIMIVLAVALLAGGYWFLQKSEEAPPAVIVTETPATGNVVDVTYTDELGFSPKSVAIKQGDSVRFVNESSQPSWPAAAVHPTHSVYPVKSPSDCLGSSFDACRGVPPGESWTFVFTAVGEWRYHDHLEASRTGVVMVTAP